MDESLTASSYSTRPARASDVAHLALIETESFSDPWSVSAFRDVLKMPSAWIAVAVDARDIPVAYCVLLTAADEGEIANLAVAATSRRLGLAGLLLKEALAHARRQQVVKVFLEVRESNLAARSLYRAHKFEEIGRRRGYYQRPPEDALVLQWTGAAC